MVDFKGKCSKCKKNTTAINPGLLCGGCQMSFHSDCLLPAMSMQDLKSAATTERQWLCKKCQKDKEKIARLEIRKKEEIIDLSKRIDMIIEVRELLELAELALDQLQEKHDNLVKLNKFLKHENLILSRRLAYLDSGYKFKVELLDQMNQARKSTIKPGTAEETAAGGKFGITAEDAKGKKKEDEKEGEEDVTKDFKTFAKYAGLDTGERAAFTIQGKLKKLSKTWFTHLCLFLCVIIYTCIGGLIFHFLEKDGTAKDTPMDKAALVQSYSAKLPSGGNETIQEFETGVRDRLSYDAKVSRGEDELHWGYVSSIFFCGTVYTTIGYGHMYPETTAGKVVVILYATLGVPLFLLALADFGAALTRWIKVLWNLLRRCKKGGCRKKAETGQEDKEEEELHLPVTLAIVIELIYLSIGCVIFHYWEGWNFLDSFYFVFESIATIGYGDFVPSNQLYLIFGMLYILLGLAFSSMTINIVREKMVDTMHKTSAKIGQTLESYVDELTNELAKSEGLGLEERKRARSSAYRS